jgi:hypothetical protein
MSQNDACRIATLQGKLAEANSKLEDAGDERVECEEDGDDEVRRF